MINTLILFAAIRKMNPMDKRISDFLDYLQLKNEYGQTLYGHLAQIIAKLLDDKPESPVEAMTPISLEIKNAAGALGTSVQYESELTDEEIKLVEHILTLYERRNGGLDGLSKQEVKGSKVVKTNVIELNNQLKLLNVPSFDDLTAQLLQMRINEFSKDREGYFSEVKFFGEFTAKDGFYYVLECLPIKARTKMYRYKGQVLEYDAENTPNNCKNLSIFVPEKNIAFLTERKVRRMEEYLASILREIDPENLEFDLTTINAPPKLVCQGVYPSGDGAHVEGVNRYVYFVTKNLTELETLWVRLPDVEARQLRMSRFVNARLSGDLGARIYDKIPPFPGVEAHYLRCVIARIKHGAALAPAPCVYIPEEPDVPDEEEMDENQARELKQKEFLDPNIVNDVFKDDIEEDQLYDHKADKHFLTWPTIQPETEEIQYEELFSLDNWVHVCPILSHHGVVLPFEMPEQEEQEEPEPEEEPEEAQNEAENDAENDAEVEEEAHKNEEQEEEAEEQEEKPIDIGPLAKDRLKAAYAESDEKRILEENAAAVKEVAKQKVKFTAPAAEWQIVRDTWEPELKINEGIYKTDRYFGIEMPPVDITCKEEELPEKEQAYWDKEQEIEDKLKEKDELFNEGDKYDAEKEVLEIQRPEVMAPASGDVEIIIHTNKLDEVSVQAETGKNPAYKVITNRLMHKNSPVCVASERWGGMMNVCYNHSNKDVITFASVYIGNGLQTPALNNFDQVCQPVAPPMCMPPADLLEEPDVVHELEQEVFNRYGDAEQKDRDAIAKIRADREEKRRQREERKRERELAKLRALEERHEGEEEERPETEKEKEEEVKEPEPVVEEEPKQKGKKKAAK